MSVKIAAIYQPEGCRVSVPASAMCARSPHLALIFAIPDGLDKTDLESWRRSMGERRMGMSKYGRRARAPSLIDTRSPWRPGASEVNRLSRRRHGSCDGGDWVGSHSPQACPRTSVRRFRTHGPSRLTL